MAHKQETGKTKESESPDIHNWLSNVQSEQNFAQARQRFLELKYKEEYSNKKGQRSRHSYPRWIIEHFQ